MDQKRALNMSTRSATVLHACKLQCGICNAKGYHQVSYVIQICGDVMYSLANDKLFRFLFFTEQHRFQSYTPVFKYNHACIIALTTKIKALVNI